MKVLIRIVSLISLILTMIVIFGFSNQDGQESGKISEIVARKIVEVLPSSRNLTAAEKEQKIKELHPIIRKLAHFTIYTIVGMSACSFICTFNTSWKFRVCISIFIGLLYAITDEIHQRFIPGRSGEIRDVMIDTLGVATGVFIIWCIVTIRDKRNRNT